VKSSSHMEHQGLVNALMFLESSSVKVGTLVTDRHKQISKYMRENIHILNTNMMYGMFPKVHLHYLRYSVIIIASLRYQEETSKVI